MVKLAILLFAYLVAAPLVGLLARRQSWLCPLLFFGMILLTAIPEDLWTVTPGNILWYRGHVSGFLFSLQTMAAIALLIACWKKSSDLLPARTFLTVYGIWFVASAVSVVFAMSIDLGLMAIWKYCQPALIFAAAFLYMHKHGEDAFSIIAGALIVGLCIQVPLVLKQRFLDGYDRPWGAFVHSNNLGMWAYLGAIPLFAHALSKMKRWKEAVPALVATGAAGICILLSLSRAAIAVFVLAAILLIASNWIATRNRKVGIIAIGLLAASILAGVLAGPKIATRFKDGDYLGETDLRTALNETGAVMFNDHPMTGVGWNNFALVNSRPHPDYSSILEKWHAQTKGTYIDTRFFRRNPLPESVWWVALAETGAPGAFATVLLLLASFLIIARAAVLTLAEDPWHWFFIGLFIAMSFLLAHTFIERILIVVTPVTTLWLILTAAALARISATSK